VIHAFHAQHPGVPLRSICRWAGVSRSWFYEQPTARTPYEQQDVALRDAIEKIVLELPGYGYRRVTEELKALNWKVNHIRDATGVGSESFGSCAMSRSCVASRSASSSLPTAPMLTGFGPIS
jgi:hypothetical protein